VATAPIAKPPLGFGVELTVPTGVAVGDAAVLGDGTALGDGDWLEGSVGEPDAPADGVDDEDEEEVPQAPTRADARDRATRLEDRLTGDSLGDAMSPETARGSGT
jgi:hypothetical protein